jgi:FemAB-related protein (PEP-CTERM system-associated)
MVSIRLSIPPGERQVGASRPAPCRGFGHVNVVLLEDNRRAEWERYVEDSPHASFGHELGWRNVVAKTYRHAPRHLMAIEGESVKGLLPLFLIVSRLFGRFLATAPYLSYGGLLATDPAAAGALVDAARKVAEVERARYVEIRGRELIGHSLALKDKYCTLLLPLGPDPDALWGRFEGRARKSVRKALRSGLSVVRGHHLVEAFAEVASRHMRDLGTPFHRLDFYRNILSEFPDRSDILMARRDDRYIGGLLLVTSKDTIFPLYGGGLTGYRTFAPMSLLIWETIRYGCEKGFACIDFGRSQWESGTFLFKRQWAARPVPLFYEYHLAGGVRMADMDPNNPVFRLPIAIWKRLPVRLTKALGPSIIRDIV